MPASPTTQPTTEQTVTAGARPGASGTKGVVHRPGPGLQAASPPSHTRPQRPRLDQGERSRPELLPSIEGVRREPQFRGAGGVPRLQWQLSVESSVSIHGEHRALLLLSHGKMAAGAGPLPAPSGPAHRAPLARTRHCSWRSPPASSRVSLIHRLQGTCFPTPRKHFGESKIKSMAIPKN